MEWNTWASNGVLGMKGSGRNMEKKYFSKKKKDQEVQNLRDLTGG